MQPQKKEVFFGMMNLIYEIWPISWIEPRFKGDRRSALQKIIDYLPYLSAMGITHLWLSPIFPSPWVDHGYDVADYRAIDPRFGTMEQFDKLIKVAHQNHIRVLMDLVMNHTSTSHLWFKDHPEYYCWSDSKKRGWSNLFDDGPAWARVNKRGYYLHLFNKGQADLNWFPDGPSGKPNEKLVKEFQAVVDFWVMRGIDGFRLDAMQCVNKDPRSSNFDPFATANQKYRSLATKVIRKVFNGRRANLFLLMECLDLNGKLVKYYYEHTPVDAVMDNTPVNTLSITDDQSVTKRNLDDYINVVKTAFERCPDGYAHVTESHDCPRFPTAAGVDGKTAINILFGGYKGQTIITPRTIVVYQGQELGLGNPDKEQLPDKKLLKLDAQTKMRVKRGESIDALRATSRANARVLPPMEEYERQKKDKNSCLHYFLKLFK